MKRIATILASLFFSSLIFAQSQNVTQHHFECFGNNTSVPLPDDFLGPKYFPYEGGSIIDFYTDADTCVVSMLCGETGELKLDESYKAIPEKSSESNIYFYSEIKNKYARKVKTAEYIIMYDHANESRKEMLDKIFDYLQNKY